MVLTGNVFLQEAKPFDAFPVIRCGDFLARMDWIYVELDRNPNSTIHIIYYGGRYRKETIWNYKTYQIEKIKLHYPHRDDGLNLAKSIPLYFSSTKKYPQEFKDKMKGTLTMANGGYRNEAMVVIWLIPKGAKTPEPQNATIDEKNIKFRAATPIKIQDFTQCYGGSS